MSGFIKDKHWTLKIQGEGGRNLWYKNNKGPYEIESCAGRGVRI